MSGLIDRAPGDDVVIQVRLRRSSFETMTRDPEGRSVDVGSGALIGYVPDRPEDAFGGEVWTLVVWSGEPVWRGVPEQIPANEDSAQALRAEITEHKFYVAHCAACEQTADGDGCEFANSPEEAVAYVADHHGWIREEDGRLLCEACRPEPVYEQITDDHGIPY